MIYREFWRAGLLFRAKGEVKLTGAMSAGWPTQEQRTEPDSGRTRSCQADAGLRISSAAHRVVKTTLALKITFLASKPPICLVT